MANIQLNDIYKYDWVVFTADLEPMNGELLQPTGFPDIGFCIYRGSNGERRCLVESEQSMANRLESVCAKPPGVWVDELTRLPLIRVVDINGGLLATNLTEPHRIASSYILQAKPNDAAGNSDVMTLLQSEFELISDGAGWPLDKRAKLEKAIFALDPSALIHGFQFVQWKFVGLRQSRLLHARLESELAEEPEVHYGMVKVDSIEPELCTAPAGLLAR
jgi:CRISPR-associated protein Csb1